LNCLTTREANRIQEGLHLEQALVAKFGALANQVTDPECRRVLGDVQAMHRRHYDVLRRQVADAVGSSAGITAQGLAMGGQPTSVRF
jgi:hypothetical protein